MEKATLIADEAGSRLSFKREVVILELPQGAAQRVGVGALKQILVRGDIWLSSTLVDKVLGAGVSLVVLPGRARDPARHLLPQPGAALDARLAQYAAFLDETARLTLARTLVMAKIEAQIQCLEQRGVSGDLARFLPSAEASLTIPALMGAEGAASARYFRLWSGLLDPVWGFSGRNRRPPKDPINALLSLGYTLSCHAVGRLAAVAGFETALGFLHAPTPGRPGLALDLVEPLRPWVDEWVLTLCADGSLTPEDFTLDGSNGCRLAPEASRLFFHRWYSLAEHWFEHEARRHLDALRQQLGLRPAD